METARFSRFKSWIRSLVPRRAGQGERRSAADRSDDGALSGDAPSDHPRTRWRDPAPERARVADLPDGATLSDTERPVAAGTVPREIAGYRLVRKLGEGGMGVVFEAEQKSPRRAVALKVVRSGAYVDEQRLRLFQREIQALARLKHASIAAIHESGSTEDGQHYFAMELVRGVPLDRYLAELPVDSSRPRSGLHQRLQLFLQLCDAISYAHQRGVIHRDLKPSNILILPGVDSSSGNRSSGSSPGPKLKVLDFGLAHMTDSDVAAATMVTAAGAIQGTLAYMSPEQARGNSDEIDLRSDVYSLGIILYELLTDTRPYEVDGALHDAVRVICEAAPARPSGHRRALKGDLETIVLKALAKEPPRRYQGVTALAEDIERYLNHQPILARPPSTAYQLRKLVLRHRGVFAFVGTLMILLSAFAVIMGVMFGMQRAERLKAQAAQAQAEAEQQRAQGVSEFLQGMLSSVAPEEAQGRQVNVRYILDEAVRRMETELAEAPRVRATIQAKVGDVYRQLGLLEEAEPHIRGAMSARRTMLGEEHPEFAASLQDLAWLEHDRSNYARAESLFSRALDLRNRFLGTESTESAVSKSGLADQLRHLGRISEAKSLHHEAIATLRARPGDGRLELAASLDLLADMYEDMADYGAAAPLLREEIAIKKSLHGPGSYDDTLSDLAGLLTSQGELDEAVALFQEALDHARETHGAESKTVAILLNDMGLALYKRGDFARAADAHRESHRIWSQLHGEDHLYVAIAEFNLARALHEQGDYHEAEAIFRRVVPEMIAAYGEESFNAGALMAWHCRALASLGRYQESETELRKALRLLETGGVSRGLVYAGAQSTLGLCLTGLGRYREAEVALREAETIILPAKEASITSKRKCIERLADLYAAWGKPQQAEQYRAKLAELSTR